MIYFDQEDPGPRGRASLSPALPDPEDYRTMASRTRRFLFSILLFFVVCGFLGTVVSQRLGAQSSTDESTLRNDLKSFTKVYGLVEQNYAEPLTGDKAEQAIYDGAIPGMLRVLDPHSSFYDPKAYAKMREDQHGKYYGVGMTDPAAEQQDRRGLPL